MIIYPAIDLRNGHCVRLRQGLAAQETVFADDPVTAAQRWVAEGASWLHVVNLDGAFGQAGTANRQALMRILAAVSVPVQFGGGLRSLDDIAQVIDLGVSRVVLGTVAVRQPEIVVQALDRWGAERIAVGLDAREGMVAVSGWAEISTVQAVTLAVRLRDAGLVRVIYTDIARDGMLNGVNVPATAQLAQSTGLRVIASGGVASAADLIALRRHETEGVEGAIVGMALYTGALSLTAALAAAQGD